MKQLFQLSRNMRKLVCKEYKLIDHMIPREVFKVNNVTKLLSPLILNYRLRIQIDDLRKSDILSVLHFMQANKLARVESIVTDCQSWSDSIRRFLEIGASIDIPKARLLSVLKEIAPFLKEFKMDDVRKPKHLQLVPEGINYLQLNEDPEFVDYLSSWLIDPVET